MLGSRPGGGSMHRKTQNLPISPLQSYSGTDDHPRARERMKMIISPFHPKKATTTPLPTQHHAPSHPSPHPPLTDIPPVGYTTRLTSPGPRINGITTPIL